MSHIEYEKWVNYVTNNVDEKTREVYEQHLFVCDECLHLYMKAVDLQAPMLPKLSNDFTDEILDHIANQIKPKQLEKRTRILFQKSFFHYVIAAAMTIILMSSGIFGQLTQVASQIEEKTTFEQKESFTDELIHKTLAFIQVFERNKEVR